MCIIWRTYFTKKRHWEWAPPTKLSLVVKVCQMITDKTMKICFGYSPSPINACPDRLMIEKFETIE